MPDSRQPDPSPDVALPPAGSPARTGAASEALLSHTGEHLAGRCLDRYAVHSRVGAGGFARVYRAYDPELELDVALKILKPELAVDPDTVERFRREASTAARLRHPNVATVLNVGRLDEPFEDAPTGTPFLVMDYLPDGLGRRLAERGTLLEAELARIGEDVARGLAYAHERGVVHRDVKPDNVLFAADGRALVTDFGIARAVAAAGSSASRQVVLGTPSYFSPEQARGLPLDGRSDIYALGVTLFQGATGTLPFGGDDWYEVMRQHVEAEPPSPRERNPQLSTAFEAIVLRCLAKDPADRFQTASELADALSALRVHGAEAATLILPAFPSGAHPRPRRRRAMAMGLLAAGAGAAAVLGWLALSDGAAATRARLAGPSAPIADSMRAQVPAAESALTVIDTAPPPPPVATLVVDAPPGATVQFDGSRVSRGAWRNDSVTAGRPHVVRASIATLDGCPTATDRQQLTLAPGEVRALELRLVPCGQLGLDVRPPRGRFTLTAKQPGGIAPREGSLPLATPLILPEGWYQLVVRANRCGEYNDSVRVVAGATPRPQPIVLYCE